MEGSSIEMSRGILASIKLDSSCSALKQWTQKGKCYSNSAYLTLIITTRTVWSTCFTLNGTVSPFRLLVLGGARGGGGW